MVLQEIEQDIQDLDPIDVYHKYLLTNDVWYFKEHLGLENPREHFEGLKFFLSKKLDIHVNNITLVGSAKTCYSFTPGKGFKQFDDQSDFDLVLVSRDYFYFFWEAFLNMSNNTHIHNYCNLTSSVFRKFISIKNLELNHRNNDFKKWLKKVDALKKDLQTIYGIQQEVNFRIYESWKYVQLYHIEGIRELKEQLKESGNE